jgi:Cyclic nucleotide-binding domain
MRVEGGVTAVSWIPSEAVSGVVYRMPFEVGVSHYDDPPPDTLPDLDEFLAADRARFVNEMRVWVEVTDGAIVDYGQSGRGRIGATTLRVGGLGMSFAAVPFSDRQSAEQIGTTTVRFEQTCGGRTGVPAPRRVDKPPYVQFNAPLAWTTLAVTLHADGRQESQLVAGSPFPRHWIYDDAGQLTHKSARINYHRWSTDAFGGRTPWGAEDSAVVVTEAESALERELSLRIMRAGAKPQIRRIKAGDLLTRQGDEADELYLLLDGLLRVDVDGQELAQIGPGAVLGERAILESGRRTASLTAVTRCRIAVADRSMINPDLLREVASTHRREGSPSPAEGSASST